MNGGRYEAGTIGQGKDVIALPDDGNVGRYALAVGDHRALLEARMMRKSKKRELCRPL